MLTRCTSVPLIQATNPSSTSAPNFSALNSVMFVSTKVLRRKIQVYWFCMSVNRVPPDSVELSPVTSYQNGARASTKAESTKLILRHAVVSGVEASVRPGKRRQLALVLKISPASTDPVIASSIAARTHRVRCLIQIRYFTDSVHVARAVPKPDDNSPDAIRRRYQASASARQ